MEKKENKFIPLSSISLLSPLFYIKGYSENKEIVRNYLSHRLNGNLIVESYDGDKLGDNSGGNLENNLGNNLGNIYGMSVATFTTLFILNILLIIVAIILLAKNWDRLPVWGKILATLTVFLFPLISITISVFAKV